MERRLARKFLYFIAAIIILILAAGVVYQLFPGWIARTAFVPSAEFKPQAAVAPNAYDDPKMWFARPDMEKNPSAWRPAADGSETPGTENPEAGDRLIPPAKAAQTTAETPFPKGDAAVFFVHPTSYYSRSSWNAPLEDRDSDHRANLFVQGMASAFADAGEIWAPRYRQATLGAFLAAQPKNKPIILAGHSQGALHLTTLLKNRIAGTPLAKRIVAAYVIGWPVSLDTDIAGLGLPACQTPEQKGCILGWASFADPADPIMVTDAYDGTIGFDGRPRAGTRMLCTNPLTGIPDTEAPPAANIGTLKPTEGFKSGSLIAGKIGAKCDDTRGFLMIGDADVAKNYVVAGYVLPGNNYHVYDITLFWANVRADALRRLATFEGKPSPVPPAATPTAPIAIPAPPAPKS